MTSQFRNLRCRSIVDIDISLTALFYRISWRGWRHSQAPPPPLNIGRVTSSALRKTLDSHKHPPPPPGTFQGGGWSALSRTPCIAFQDHDKCRGGGDYPCHPPLIRHCFWDIVIFTDGSQYYRLICGNCNNMATTIAACQSTSKWSGPGSQKGQVNHNELEVQFKSINLNFIGWICL